MYDFVAVDFETATEQLDSACSIGIVAVKDQKVAEHFYSLIKPPKNYYNSRNVEVHHITPDMTETAPSLTELWPDIRTFFDEHIPVVAHNVHFDMSVLRLSTDAEIPDFVFVNSMDIASYFVSGSLSLMHCAEEMHIDVDKMEHHNAEDDAWLCAYITTLGIAGLGCKTLWELLAKHPEISRKPFSELRPMKAMGKRPRRPAQYETVKPRNLQPSVDHVNEGNPLFGKNIVFTGQLSIERSDAMQLAINSGACVKTAVSRKTHYLVVGKQDKDLVGESGVSTKERTAIELNGSGSADIKIIDESEFLRLAAMEG